MLRVLGKQKCGTNIVGRYADDTTVIASSEEKMNYSLAKIEEESRNLAY